MNKLLFGIRSKNRVVLKDISPLQIKSGYLSDKSSKKKNNKYNVKYWVLTTTYLYSFNSGSENEKSVNSIDIKTCKIISEDNSDEFTILYGIDKKKEIILKSDSIKDKTDWVDAIRLTISRSEGSNKNSDSSSSTLERRSNSVANIGQTSSTHTKSNSGSTQFQSSFVVFDLDTQRAIIRVYLADNSCKTLSVNVNDSVQDIMNLMRKKLGSGNYDNFVIFEIRDIVSIKLDENTKLLEIFNRWPKNATYHTHRLVFQPEDSEQLKEASKIGELEVRTNANKYSSSSIQGGLSSSTGLKRIFTETLRKKSKKKGMVMLKDIKVFQKSGYIHKKNSAKYCILQDGYLYYFDNNKPDTMSSGIINLSTTTLFRGKGLSFSLYYTGEDKMKEFEAHCRTMDEKEIWLDALIPLCNVTNSPVNEKNDSVQINSSNQTIQRPVTCENIPQRVQTTEVNNNNNNNNNNNTNNNTNENNTPSINDHVQTQNNDELNNNEKTTSEDVKNNQAAKPKMASNLPQLNTEFDHVIPHDNNTSKQLKSPFMNKYSIPFSKMSRSTLTLSYSSSTSPFNNSPNTQLQENIKIDGEIEQKEIDVQDIDKLLEEAHSALDDNMSNNQISEPTPSNNLSNNDTTEGEIKINQTDPIDISKSNVLSSKIPSESPYTPNTSSNLLSQHSTSNNTPQFGSTQNSISNTPQLNNNTPQFPFSLSNNEPYSSSITSNHSYQSNESERPTSDHVIVDIMDILDGNIQSPFDDEFIFQTDMEQQTPINLLDGEFCFEGAD